MEAQTGRFLLLSQGEIGTEGRRVGRSPPRDPMMPSRPWGFVKGRDRHRFVVLGI